MICALRLYRLLQWNPSLFVPDLSRAAVSDAMVQTILDRLREAAADGRRVFGLTHRFYRYPARFSPAFAAAAIDSLSEPDQLVVDPFMGGGTVVVQGLASGRPVVGADINSLSVFIARAKTTPLRSGEANQVLEWARMLAGHMSYTFPGPRLKKYLAGRETRNLGLPRSRAIKKAVAIALKSIDTLKPKRTQRFARCVVLRTAQWALDGRRRHTPLQTFREAIVSNAAQMLSDLRQFEAAASRHGLGPKRRTLLLADAREIDAERGHGEEEAREDERIVEQRRKRVRHAVGDAGPRVDVLPEHEPNDRRHAERGRDGHCRTMRRQPPAAFVFHCGR